MRSEGTAISVEQVTKTFRVGVGRARVREMLPSPLDRGISALLPKWWRKNTFNALDDVSLQVPMGSSVGLVGHNGAGKTTLLKVIAGVTGPTEGAARTSGRVAALIDVVVGFHPDLTGRENAYLLGAIYGHTRRRMESRMDDILEFAEIRDLADTPVKRFSTGMVARLGFGTLTALDVDILLIDEVLAVGDAAFQRKCTQWLERFRESRGTLLFVSHNLGLIRNMTSRTVHLDHGRVVDDGPTPEVLPRYAVSMERRDGKALVSHRKGGTRKAMQARGQDRWGFGGARVEKIHVEGPTADNGIDVTVSYAAAELKEAIFQVGFMDEGDRELGGATSLLLPLERRGSVRCRVRPVPLQPGIYFLVVAILSPDGQTRDRWRTERAVVIEEAGRFPGGIVGPVVMEGDWGPFPSVETQGQVG